MTTQGEGMFLVTGPLEVLKIAHKEMTKKRLSSRAVPRGMKFGTIGIALFENGQMAVMLQWYKKMPTEVEIIAADKLISDGIHELAQEQGTRIVDVDLDDFDPSMN